MNNKEDAGKKATSAWQRFLKKESTITDTQKEQFEAYLTLLQEWSTRISLTTLTSVDEILAYHFQDSMRLLDTITLNADSVLCDVGSGAGFPGIPLKIMAPETTVILIEVNQKKVRFLQEVIKKLGLKKIEINSLDWRTFLRQAPYPRIDLVCARASLQPEELVRVLKPESRYRTATLIYWASQQWTAEPDITPFITRSVPYRVGERNRKLVFLSAPQAKESPKDC